MKAKELSKYVELKTYKCSCDHTSPAVTKIVHIDRKWLERQIRPISVNEFLERYTLDQSEKLYQEYGKYLSDQKMSFLHGKKIARSYEDGRSIIIEFTDKTYAVIAPGLKNKKKKPLVMYAK